MKETSVAVVATALVLMANSLHADGPGVGQITLKQVLSGPYCWADVTVDWNLRTLLGEPLVYGNVKYDNPLGDEGGCSDGPRIRRIWLKGETAALNVHAPLYIPLVPLWPEKPGEWGFNVMGMPAWHEVVYGKRWDDEHTYHACQEGIARFFFGYGSVTGFVLQEAWHDFIGIGGATDGPC